MLPVAAALKGGGGGSCTSLALRRTRGPTGRPGFLKLCPGAQAKDQSACSWSHTDTTRAQHHECQVRELSSRR